MKISISENKTERRFHRIVEGKTAQIDYSIKANKMHLAYTEVPKELEGNGVGSAQ